MKRLMVIGGILLSVVLMAGCGGGSGGAVAGGDSGGATGGDSGTGVATVSTLAAVPSMDLSSYDKSTSASANLAALLPKSLSNKSISASIAPKGMGENLRAVGNSSRAGCEANMHKKQVVMESQVSQLERCYPEAMESLGLIEIPTGSYNLYSLTPPDMGEENMGKLCEEIPEQDVERRAACEAGEGGGKSGVAMKLRIGIIDGSLNIDMCEGGSLVNEATYTASGSAYTANAVHIGNWGGHQEAMSFSMTVDLGADGSVTDGVVDLGTAGTADATSNMNGGFGSGVMRFEALGADNSNRVRGAFKGDFTDPFTNAKSEFTGKVYSHFGGSTATGCASFSFTGTMPPMRVADMIPFDIPEADKVSFIRAFGNDLGCAIDSSNYETTHLCPNPNFDPDNYSATIKPMLCISAGETCGSVTHDGIECFAITNLVRAGDFGDEISQTFTIIANSGSPYYDEVFAYPIESMLETPAEPGFSRLWDCTGDFTEIDFMSVSQTAMETAMAKCFALEEKAFANGGMGEYNCGEQEQMNGVNDFKEGGGADFGVYGGEYGFKQSAPGKINTCSEPGEVGVPSRAGRLFVDKISDTQYCFPNIGACQSFTIANDVGTPDDVITVDNWEIDQLEYDLLSDPKTVKVTYDTSPGSCVQYYSIEQHTFDNGGASGDNWGEGGGSGQAPGEAGYIPAPCIGSDGNPIPPEQCHQICMDPNIDCRG